MDERRGRIWSNGAPRIFEYSREVQPYDIIFPLPGTTSTDGEPWEKLFEWREESLAEHLKEHLALDGLELGCRELAPSYQREQGSITLNIGKGRIITIEQRRIPDFISIRNIRKMADLATAFMTATRTLEYLDKHAKGPVIQRNGERFLITYPLPAEEERMPWDIQPRLLTSKAVQPWFDEQRLGSVAIHKTRKLYNYSGNAIQPEGRTLQGCSDERSLVGTTNIMAKLLDVYKEEQTQQ